MKSIGSNLFESKKLAEIWPYGFHYIGDVSYASCNYVAKYTTKKIFGDDSSDEFLMCSTNPGIGYKWMKEHLDKVLQYDGVYGSFGNQKVAKMPRYFEKMAEVLDNSKFVKLKETRLEKSNAITINEMLVHGIEHVEELLKYKENILISDYCSQKQGKRL